MLAPRSSTTKNKGTLHPPRQAWIPQVAT
jgi:hypothetical protein